MVGLFRTDAPGPGSSGLDVSDPAIAEAWEKVRSDSAPETWLLLGYEGKAKLKVAACGEGGAAELLESVDDDCVLFGGLRTRAGKFLCVMCTGEGVGGMQKGRAAAHKNAALNALAGTSGEVCGLGKEEFGKNLESVDF